MALVAIGHARQDHKEIKPTNVLATVADPSHLPRTDDAGARKKAELQRNGGEASYAYLQFKQAAAARETLRWPRTFPGPSTKAPAIESGTPTLMAWTPIGPSILQGNSPSSADLVSGRPTAIVTHPTNPNILYMAVAGSGVWKCTNANLASTTDWIWTNITDALPSSSALGNISVGDLVMDPVHPETLYLGMGDPLSVPAVGFFITHDGGATWAQGGALKNTISVQKIILLGADTLLVIPVGSLTGGIYRSSDGGASFASVTLPTPLNSTNFLATTGAAFSASDIVVTGNAWDETSSANIPAWITSADGGQTWARASVPTTFMPSGVTSSHNLDIHATPNVVAGLGGKGYALVADETTSKIAKGLYVTSDYGATWSFQDSPTLWSMAGGEDGGQSWYNLLLAVDPSDSRKVFAASQLASYRSLDGGLTWEQLTDWLGNTRVYAHADFHVATWSKTGPKALYMGNDGGLAILRDPYRTSVPSGSWNVASDPTFLDHTRNKGIQSQLVYTIASTTAATPSNAIDRVALGMQDNNTGIRSDIGGGIATSATYEPFPTGDGYGVLFHPLDGTKLIVASYMDLIFKTSDLSSAGKGSWTSTRPSGTPTYPTPIVPIRSDPTGNSVLTTTLDTLYKSVDFGTTWAALPMTGLDSNRFIWRIAASPTNPQVFAFTGRPASYTSDGGNTWSPFGFFPSRDISSGFLVHGISIGAEDQTLYANALDFSEHRSHIWKSLDRGATWTALDGSSTVSNGFPFGVPVHFLRESLAEPSTLYAGTDFGLYASQNAGATWSRFGTGLPMVQVTDMYEAPDGSFLRVATYGRGAWEIRLVAAPPAISLTLNPTPTHMGAGIALPFTVTVANATNTGVTWSATGGTLSATSGSTVTFTSPSVSRDLILTVASAQDTSQRASLPIKITSLDLNSDGAIDVLDLAIAAQAFTGAAQKGAANYLSTADVDGDGDVDDDDLALFLSRL